MIVTELLDSERPTWDSYVRRATHGLPQHLAGWRDVLVRTYGYDTHYLMARVEDPAGQAHVVGVMPLYVMNSMLVGTTATTMPGGLCADDDLAAQALIEHAAGIAHRSGAKRLVIQDTRQTWTGESAITSQHEEWLVEVGNHEDALWDGLNRNIRRQIRMAWRNELTADIDRSGALIDDFYDVLSRFTHRAGTPIFGRSFLANIAAVFPNGFNVLVVRHAGEPIGAYFQLEMGNTIHGVWGATLHEFLELRPVYLAYWEIMRDAITHGFHRLNMGRSPSASSTSSFKEQWGGVVRPIYQQVIGLGQTQPASSIVDQAQSDAKFRSFRQIWPKVPFPIAQYLGPKLRRHVPFA